MKFLKTKNNLLSIQSLHLLQRHLKKVLVFLAIIMVMSAFDYGEDKDNQTDLRSLAVAALKAYQQKDIETLIKLSPPDRAARIKEMITMGKLDDIKNRAFDENKWRYQSVKNWDGKLHELKKHGDTIRIRYGDINPNEVAVVQLIHVNGKWYFDDLQSPGREEWTSQSK